MSLLVQARNEEMETSTPPTTRVELKHDEINRKRDNVRVIVNHEFNEKNELRLSVEAQVNRNRNRRRESQLPHTSQGQTPILERDQSSRRKREKKRKRLSEEVRRSNPRRKTMRVTRDLEIQAGVLNLWAFGRS